MYPYNNKYSKYILSCIIVYFFLRPTRGYDSFVYFTANFLAKVMLVSQTNPNNIEIILKS